MDKLASTTKGLGRYLGATYSDIFQPSIMTKTPETFPDPEMKSIVPDTGIEHPKTDAEMTYLKNKNIDKAIRHKMKKKYVYKTDMHKIYNLILGHTNEQLQEKAALDATFQEFKTV